MKEMLVAEQFTKADRDACYALCGKGKAHATLRRLSFAVRRNSSGNSKTVNNREEVKNEGAKVYRNFSSAR